MTKYLDWKVGDRVVYAPPPAFSPPQGSKHKPLVVGKVYSLREIILHPLTGDVGVLLAEVVNSIHPAFDTERGYYANSFRKVEPRKTDISLFTAMLNRTDVREEA